MNTPEHPQREHPYYYERTVIEDDELPQGGNTDDEPCDDKLNTYWDTNKNFGIDCADGKADK